MTLKVKTMTALTLRKSGGANILSIPKAVLKALELHEGSQLELSIEGDKIVLTPILEELTLDDLLKGSPQKRLALTEEDKEWLNDNPKGKEII
jgi:AbrB family looped-hinge helix DNA binding protein